MQCQSHQNGSLFTIFHYQRSFGNCNFWNIFFRETLYLSQVFKMSTLITWFNDLFWKLSKITFDMTVFKLRSMFCGQMSVKIIDNTLVTIQSFVCFNLVVHRPSLQKNIGFTSKYPCKQMKIGKEYQKIGETCCFLGTNFLLYLYATANIYPVYLTQP